MPNDWVDLATFAWWDFAWKETGVIYSTFYNEGHFLNFAVDVRDRIKTVMEAENAGQNWSVGRVAYFGDASPYHYYGFVIKRLVAGVPSGHEWFIGLGCPQTNVTSQSSIMNGMEPFLGGDKYWEYWLSAADGDGSNPEILPEASLGPTGNFLHYHTGGALAASARGALGFTGNAANGEIVTIDGKTYTFQTTLTDVDGNVAIGANEVESARNLAAAINLDGETWDGRVGPGTAYAASMTLHPTVQARTNYVGSDPTYDLRVTAKASGVGGNSIAISTNVANSDNWLGATTLVQGGTTNSYGINAGVDGDPPDTEYHDSGNFVFFPDETARPFPVGGFMRNNYSANHSCKRVLVFNHEVPFVGIYGADGNMSAISQIMLAGDICEPRDTADVYEEGVFVWYADIDRYDFGTWYAAGGIPATSTHFQVHTLRTDGMQNTQAETYMPNAFNQTNEPRSNGRFDLSPIRLFGVVTNNAPTDFEIERTTGFNKGYLKKDVIGHQGWSSYSPHMTFEARYGVSIQFTTIGAGAMVCPWVTDAPIPFFGFPTDPRTPVRKP